MEKTEITSWRQLQRRVPHILERLHEDEDLALAAAANPLAALVELGFDIEPALLTEVSDRIRFGAKVTTTRRQLRDQMTEHGGGEFDPCDLEAVELVLSRDLRQAKASGVLLTLDDLEGVDDSHPVMEPLRAYLRLEATVPPFAPDEVYAAIRAGRRSMAVTRIRGRLKSKEP